ncbi:hypothetical protein ACIQVC_36980 [Streptomyces sp. NPDC101112]|uniref:hypothetical protein n=1 Tax=Streptomyces sp. NPDC101112 TaxID=3366105 RepID=UPI0037F45F88
MMYLAQRLIFAVASAALLLVKADMPKNFWADHADWVIWAVMITVGLTLIEPIFQRIKHGKQVLMVRQKDARIRDALGYVLIKLVREDAVKADWATTSIFAYKKQGFFRRRMQPISFIGLTLPDPILSATAHRKNHGPLGYTWAHKDRLSLPWSQFRDDLDYALTVQRDHGFAEPGTILGKILRSPKVTWAKRLGIAKSVMSHSLWTKICDRRAWKRISHDERWNMTLGEFRRMRHYSYLITWPIRDSKDRVIGVLSADVRTAGDGPLDVDLDPLASKLNSAAGRIADHL